MDLESPARTAPHTSAPIATTCDMLTDYLLYLISITSVTFWVVIWMMHFCALTNAKIKLHRNSQYSKRSINRKKFFADHANQYKLAAPPAKPESPSPNSHRSPTLDSADQNSAEPKPRDSPSSKPNDQSAANSLCIELPTPGVSIIKPLVGVDENLYANLKTFYHLDYPKYELLFCVHDPNDEAVALVDQLFKEYPSADAKLFVGGALVGVNPKINNMQPAYEATKYELILVSDSGISMRPDTLSDMVEHMTYETALVHQMPFVYDIHKRDFQSIVERVYFGTAHARAYLTADLLNINCPTGMSALMRKSLLDEVGGIKAFGQYLAEDFFFAKSFTDRGWKISISSQPALQNSANPNGDTLTTLNSRIQRWIKLRLAMVPQWTILEPFSECMLLGFFGAISISFLWAINPLVIFICHIVVWFLLDYKLLCTVQDSPLTCSKAEFALAWLVRESTALFIFLKALSSPEVTWRSRIFRLKWGGYAEEIFQEGTEDFESKSLDSDTRISSGA